MSKDKEHIELFNDDFFSPGDDVWDGIEESLPSKRKNGLFFWIGLCVLLLFSTSYFYLKSINPSPITNNSSLQDIENTGSVLEKKSDKLVYNNTFNNNEISTNNENKSTEYINHSEKENQVASSKTNGHNLLIKKGVDIPLIDPEIDEYDNSILPRLVEKDFTSVNNISNNSTERSLLSNTTIPTNNLQLIEFDFDNSVDNKIHLVEEKPIYNSLVAFVGKEFYLKQPNIQSNNPLSELIGESVLENDISVTLGIAVEKNKNLFITGLNYSRNNYRVHYDINLPYDLSVEKNHGAISTNHLNHSLPTAISTLETDLILQRETMSPVEHNENVYLTLDSEISYDIFRFNFSYLRKIGNFYTGLSLLPGYKANMKLVNQVESHHTYVHTRSFEAKSKLINRYSLDFSIDGAYLKKINSRNYIGIRSSIQTDLLNESFPIRFIPSIMYKLNF